MNDLSKKTDYLDNIILEIQENFSTIMNENNTTEENGKEIISAGEEANFLFVESLSSIHMKNWFEKYEMLKENMEKYAPNMANFALKKFLEDTPFDFLPEMSQKSKTSTDGILHLSNILFNLSENFSSEIKRNPELIEIVKDKVHEEFNSMYKSDNMKYHFSRFSIPNIIQKTDSDFYRDVIPFDIIEIAKNDPCLNYNVLMSQTYWASKDKEKYNYGYSEKVMEKLHSLEKLPPEEYFKTLTEKQKSKEFKKHFEQYKYSSLNESQMILSFVKNYNYPLNQTEKELLKSRFKFDKNIDNQYWELLDAACEKAKIGHNLQAIPLVKDDTGISEQFKI